MMTRIAIAACALTLFSVTATGMSTVRAQVITSEGGQPVDDQGQPVQQQQQVPVQEQPIMEGTPPPQQPIMEPGQEVQEAPQQERLVRQISGYLSVPFFLTDGNIGQNITTGAPVDVGPGFGIHGRFGWELGFIVLEGAVGYEIHGLSNTNSTFQDIWVGLGARFQLLNRSRMVPFVSAAFRLNIFSERVSSGVAGSSTVSTYDVDPGAQVALGLTIEITQSFGIEAAVSSNFLFGVGDYFQDFQFALQPWIGATLFI